MSSWVDGGGDLSGMENLEGEAAAKHDGEFSLGMLTVRSPSSRKDLDASGYWVIRNCNLGESLEKVVRELPGHRW